MQGFDQLQTSETQGEHGRTGAKRFPSRRPTQQRARRMEETGLAPHAPPPPTELRVATLAEQKSA